MRPTRPFYFLAVLAMLLVLPKVGCVAINLSGSSTPANCKETRTLTAPAAVGVVVRTQNGAVTVKRGEGAETAVVAHLAATTKERLADTRLVVEPQADGALLVTVAWPDGKALGNEGCGFEVTVPSMTNGVRVTTTNGAVTLASLSGPARLNTTNGRIVVTDHRGPVEAHTTNGAISLTDVTGDVDAHSTNGKVEMTGVAGRATAHTTNGAVRVGLAGGAAGPVDIRTTNGSAELTIPSGYAGRFALSTSNGSMRYPGGPLVHDVSAGRTHASFTIGAGSAESTVATSNGSIEVRIAE